MSQNYHHKARRCNIAPHWVLSGNISLFMCRLHTRSKVKVCNIAKWPLQCPASGSVRRISCIFESNFPAVRDQAMRRRAPFSDLLKKIKRADLVRNVAICLEGKLPYAAIFLSHKSVSRGLSLSLPAIIKRHEPFKSLTNFTILREIKILSKIDNIWKYVL